MTAEQRDIIIPTRERLWTVSRAKFNGMRQDFLAKDYPLVYGNILSLVCLESKNPFVLLGQERYQRSDPQDADVDWRLVNGIATGLAFANSIPIPQYAFRKFSHLAEGYPDEQTMVTDLKARLQPQRDEEFVEIYRGTNEPSMLQLAGALRTHRFTLTELESLPPTLIALALAEDADLTAPSYRQHYIDSYRKRETRYPLDYVRVDILCQSGMDNSLWLSTSTDIKEARKFGRHVIKARVPKSSTIDVEKIWRTDKEESELGPGEGEVGVKGWINPDWIVDVI